MSIHLRGLRLGRGGLVLALGIGACSRPDGAASGTEGTAASQIRSAVASPLRPPGDERVAQLPKTLAAEALRALRAIPDDADAGHPEYLAARRAVAAGTPFWRRLAPTGSEILIGPPVSALEAGGAMAFLDGALTEKDAIRVRQYRVEAERATLHIEHEVGQTPLDTRTALLASSVGAYELGLRILDGTPGAPDGRAAMQADVAGAFDGLDRAIATLLDVAGPRASAEVRTELARWLDALRPALSEPDAAHDLIGRGPLVLATGELGAQVRRLGKAMGVEAPLPYAPRMAVRGGGIDEPVNALTVPGPRKTLKPVPPEETAALVAVGERLFSDPRLSKDERRSCASCHVPSRAFADGLVRQASLDPGTPTLRHTPSLLYAPLFASQLWDGRRITRESQALGVIHSAAEMGLAEGALAKVLSADEKYAASFAAIPGGLTEENVARALGAFQVARMVPASAPIDRFARGERDALSPEELAGLDVFAGPGRCARCHVPPSFGGVRPRDFSTPVYAVLGVPTRPGGSEVDPDPGRYGVTKSEADRGRFKTPTTRNVVRTAPYFHHGAFPTLEQVVDFYDQGGIPDARTRIENLDPDVRKLDLKPEQKRALLAFMRSGLLDAELR